MAAAFLRAGCCIATVQQIDVCHMAAISLPGTMVNWCDKQRMREKKEAKGSRPISKHPQKAVVYRTYHWNMAAIQLPRSGRLAAALQSPRCYTAALGLPYSLQKPSATKRMAQWHFCRFYAIAQPPGCHMAAILLSACRLL